MAKTKVLSAALVGFIAGLNFSAAQTAAFDNLPWNIEHDDDDVREVAHGISIMSDADVQALLNLDGDAELDRIMQYVIDNRVEFTEKYQAFAAADAAETEDAGDNSLDGPDGFLQFLSELDMSPEQIDQMRAAA